ncbi:MAG: cysteine synthase family protein [Candidatus Bathyarchaeota archaeon]|nr:cysteine synthase family protein [Candidatus Bathyarchaeota archaeon]
MIRETALDLTGNTPLVKIRCLTEKDDATILAKLEMFNPSGSVKDRIVKYIVENAERGGHLKKGDTIVEATSGNTGIALSMIGTMKGYRVKIFMSRTASQERREIIRSYGGEILDQTNGQLDAFIAGIGTGGTITGVGRRLKEHRSGIQVIGCEPDLETKIEGLLNFTDSKCKPQILDLELVDELVRVKDQDALKMTREIARREGLFVGVSSGAVIHVALQKAKELGKDKRVVVVLADGGSKYLSTTAFKEPG